MLLSLRSVQAGVALRIEDFADVDKAAARSLLDVREDGDQSFGGSQRSRHGLGAPRLLQACQGWELRGIRFIAQIVHHGRVDDAGCHSSNMALAELMGIELGEQVECSLGQGIAPPAFVA